MAAASVAGLEPGLLQDGDVILRHAHGRWSGYFRDASPIERRFSHVGIVVRDANDVQVIHADASDTTGVGHVRSEPLSHFLRGADDWAVFRAPAPEQQRARIAAEARTMLGLPFDARFDLDDAGRIYCTELVYRAFLPVLGPGCIPRSELRGRTVVFLDACYRNPAFRQIAERSPQNAVQISQN